MESLKSIVFAGGLSLYVIFFYLKAYLQQRSSRVNPLKLTVGSKPAPLAFNERLIKVFGFAFVLTAFLQALYAVRPRLFWEHHLTDVAGLGVFIFGLGLFVVAMVGMRDSWRAGIDPGARTALVSEGVFRISRNPAFTGYLMMLAGFMLAYPSAVSLGLLIVTIMVIHTQILHEEEFLKALHGSAYEAYRRSVPRYFWLL